MSEALEQAFSDMQARYNTGVVETPMTFYFSLGEEPGQKWTAHLTTDSCQFEQGKVGEADCILKTSEELFLKLIRGEWIPGIMDFMTGKIKSNDPTRLTVLKDCFI